MRDWKNNKKIVGVKTPLKTLEGEWIIPKKFSVAQQDELKIIQHKLLKDAGLTAAQIQEIDKIRANKDAEISDEAFDAAMTVSTAPDSDSARFMLLNGISRHSFVDEPEGSEEVSEQLVEDLMQYSDIALEIAEIVRDFNAPLAKKTSETSGTSQNGSTEEVSSTKETPSQTKESPQS